MSKETRHLTVDQTPLDVAQRLHHVVMAKGLTIEGNETYEDRRYLRTADISSSHYYSFAKPIEGHGKGVTIEAALVRALYTQAQYETHGTNPYDIPEDVVIDPDIDKLRRSINPVASSQLDSLFDDEPILWLMREGDMTAATCQTRLSGEGTEVLTERDKDPLTALESLVSRYHFRRHSEPKIMRLPLTLFRT